MEIKVKVSQAAAVRRGELQWGDVAVVIESWDGWTAQERDVLAGLLVTRADGVIRADIAPTAHAVHELCVELAARKEEQARAKAALAAALAAAPATMCELARREIEMDRYDTLLVPAYSAPGGVRVPTALTRYFYAADRPGEIRGADPEPRPSEDQAVCPVPPDVAAALAAEVTRRDAAALAKKAESEAAKAAARELRQARLDERLALLMEVASAEQRDRMDAGFLGDREIDTILRDAIFTPLVQWGRLVPLIYDDGLPCDGQCDGGDHLHDSDDDVYYSVADARELTADEFARFRELRDATGEIRAALPEATIAVTPRRHVMTCARYDCEARRERLGVVVEVRLPAGSVFSREFALALSDVCIA